MEKLTFLELAKKILKEENRPLTVEEIWKISQQKGYNKLVATEGKTPWRTIGAQVYVNIRDDVNSPFVKIDSKPRKFFLKELVSKEDLEKIEKKEKEVVDVPARVKYSERDLHPFLTYFAYTYMGVYTKTIRHEKSIRKSYAQWLHPDLVGVHFPIGEWKEELIDFVKEIGSNPIKIYSFEMKRELTFSNLRESFFQTVSNSSWADEGYLVAAKISQDDEFLSELKRLSTSFGIGVIKIDIEDPDSSAVLFSARYRNRLDWDTINKLSMENSDLREFLRRVKIDLSSNEVRREKYDKVYDVERLKEMIKK
jgi:hypothetical protein